MCDDARLALVILALSCVASGVIVAVGVAAGLLAYDRIVARARRIEAAARDTLDALGRVSVMQGRGPAPQKSAGPE